ncbi:MAG: cytochrome c oxidase subunit 3 [Candidatus Sumerlaeota bacterium]|nr:cytochrome c oxidase subunit 3 [Candidatus Sumerlaeota bacterium]
MSREDPRVPHHFESAEQQTESARLGMWVFLATEILLFGGLFCAYSVYRANHPDVFYYGTQFLDKHLGALNTMVLICSSFTMAWAVRCAQLGERRALMVLLSMTLLCAALFLGVKAIEYRQKWKHGLLWARKFRAEALERSPTKAGATWAETASAKTTMAAPDGQPTSGPAASNPLTTGTKALAATAAFEDRTSIPPAGTAPAGVVSGKKSSAAKPSERTPPENVQVFFSIYFLLTGLHGLHVIAGMLAIGWILRRARRGEFSSGNFLAVDLVGLYWHLVDIIWIYLFPLLYLIH